MSLSLYPIIKKLGEGSFGTTYLATNTLMPSQSYCVVKQLTPTSTDPKVQQLIKDRFKQEAITLENLGKDSNGKIPSLYAYFVERGEFYLIQEYIDGQTLNERVQAQGLFTEIQVRQLLTDILSTLVYVHQRGIVHRDIKPENIMLRHRDNKPILIDFGAVKETMSTVTTAAGNTAPSIVIGTPGFMPIEQMSGRPMFASDIYALGLTAIYLMTGKMPTEIETDLDRANIDWQSLAPNISPQLTKILNKSIQHLARDRYQNAQEMLEDLNSSSPPFPPSPTIGASIPISNDRDQTVYISVPKTTSNSRSSQARPLIVAMIVAIVGGGFLVLGHNYSRKEFVRSNNNSQQTDISNSNPVTNGNSKITSSSSSTNDLNNAPTSKNSTKNTERSNATSRENPTDNTERSNVATKENPTENTERSKVATKENPTDNTERSNVATKENPTENVATKENPTDNTERSNVATKENPTDNTQRDNAASRENPTDNIERNNAATKENSPDNIERSNAANKENSPDNIERSNAATKENSPDRIERDPTDSVRAYYSKINNRNYAGAWDSLPTALQNNQSIHPNGYNSFLDWWAKQVANVEIQQTNLVSQTDRNAVVDVDLKYVMKAGGASPHRIRYVLVKNEQNNQWIIQKIGLR